MTKYDDITEPLASGATLPDHPATTTSKKITAYGPVFDADDNTELTAGLHRATVSVLMGGGHVLSHMYRYAILSHDGARRIYHTRKQVIIKVNTEPVDEPV